MSGSGQPTETFRGTVPLTSIEQFHLHDSSKEFPNAITGRFHFTGTIDKDIAQAAWRIMLERQRIGMWPIEKTVRGMAYKPDLASEASSNEIVDSTFHWQEVADWPAQESELKLEGASSAGIPYLDMIDGSGFGIWCLVGKEKATLLLSVHHAYTDGPGGVIIIRDWLTIYHNLKNGKPADKGLGRLDFKKWRTRNRLGLLSWAYVKKLPLQLIAVFGAAKFVFRKFRYFGATNSGNQISEIKKSSKPSDNPGATFPGIAGRWIDETLVSSLDQKATEYGVRLNSLLMVKLIRSVDGWQKVSQSANEGTVQACDSPWIRVILPISIRGLSDRHLPAANKATIVQIDRKKSETEDERQASRMLDREIKIIVGFMLDRIFLIAVRLCSVSPWLLGRLARNAKPRGTVIFTNLGAPLRKTRACDFQTVGDLNLVDFDLCGPIRSGTPVNVAFQRHEDRARITLHYDRRIFSAETVNEFLASFIEELSH